MDRFRTFCLDHRRPLAAACVTLAVLAGLQSLRPADDTVGVLVAARDLPSGHVLTGSDLRTARTTAAARPAHVLSEDDAVGRRVAGPMRQGEPLTDRRVISPRRLGDQVLTMVSVDDPGSTVGLRVGDVVDVVAPREPSSDETTARVVVRAATVAALPSTEQGDTPVVGLSTASDDALDLAGASLGGGLRLVIRS